MCVQSELGGQTVAELLENSPSSIYHFSSSSAVKEVKGSGNTCCVGVIGSYRQGQRAFQETRPNRFSEAQRCPPGRRVVVPP